MRTPTEDLEAVLAEAVTAYRAGGAFDSLLASLEAVASSTSAERLIAAAEPYRDVPEVAGPLYERIVAERPTDARALVVLANAYWLAGRGPEVVSDLASRAMAADPGHRGAWHLWALAEAEPRARVARWRQVVSRFPDDDLARAVLADNAASLAGSAGDEEALDLAIESYQALLARATEPAQREALQNALRVLGGWRP
ncbi:MAG TPA: hypothetical protein VMM18_03750 [Gemmatimonadaceae bacterium]|nr:hypothetical protein [Gemmatimonadaceae bacterium]